MTVHQLSHQMPAGELVEWYAHLKLTAEKKKRRRGR